MNKENVKRFENLFIELRKSIMTEIDISDGNGDWNKGDDFDREVLERARSLDLKLLGRQNFMLKKIDLAMLKIKNGTFGKCEECEGEIEMNRMRARPVATTCIACKEELERTEDKILYEKKSHTHGKTLFSNVIQFNRVQNEDNILELTKV